MQAVAGDEGIEPSSSDLEADVLPLHQSPIGVAGEDRTRVCRICNPEPYRSATATVARRARFELATSGFEARRSIQLRLSAGSFSFAANDSVGIGPAGVESNPRPVAYMATALPIELQQAREIFDS